MPQLLLLRVRVRPPACPPSPPVPRLRLAAAACLARSLTQRSPDRISFLGSDNAAKCPKWPEHCKATHSSEHWKRERAACKAARLAPAAAASAAGSSSSSSTPLAPLPNGAAAGGGTVYYKDSSLKLPITLNQWSFDDLYKALEQIYPREEPTPEALTLTLRPYQKQDLAFMVDQEQSSDSTLVGANGKRGGILADEMGAFGSSCPSRMILPSLLPALL